MIEDDNRHLHAPIRFSIFPVLRLCFSLQLHFNNNEILSTIDEKVRRLTAKNDEFEKSLSTHVFLCNKCAYELLGSLFPSLLFFFLSTIHYVPFRRSMSFFCRCHCLQYVYFYYSDSRITKKRNESNRQRSSKVTNCCRTNRARCLFSSCCSCSVKLDFS
jgi:hypothetical protein